MRRKGEGGRGRGLGVQTSVEAALFFACQHHIKQVTTSNVSRLVLDIIFHILTDNYFNLNHLAIVSFSLSLFRFHCNLLFVIVAL